MEGAIVLQMVALALQYGPKFGIDIVEAAKRMKSGEKVEDLIKELDAKRDDLSDLNFGANTSSNAAKLMKENGDNQDGGI
jgi:hypothetical protein